MPGPRKTAATTPRPEASAPATDLAAARLSASLEAMERLSSDGVGLFGTDGRLHRANPVAGRLLGLNVPGARLEDATADCLCRREGEPLPYDLNPLRRALADGVPAHDIPLVWRRPDGKLIDLAWSLEPLPATPGEPHEVLAIIRDTVDAAARANQITELLSDQLQQRHLLHLVFENVESGVALFDHEDRLALWNRPFEDIWGYRRAPGEPAATMEELLRAVPWDFTRAQRARFDAAMAGARETIEPVTFEVASRSAYLQVYTCRLAGGRRLWALTDFTERRRMHQELQAAKEQAEADRNLLQQVFANVESGIVAVDARECVVAYNPVFIRMWSIDEAWLASRPTQYALADRLGEALDQSRRRAYGAQLTELRQAGRTGVVEIETSDGRTYAVYTAPLGDGGRLFSFRDYTARRRLESSLAARNAELARSVQEQQATLAQLAEANQQLEESGRLKSEFLANTSHELRTPLNSILGYLGLIVDRLYRSEDEARQFALTAQRSAEHLLAVINDLLDIARIESGKMDVQAEPVVLWLAIEETCETIRPELDAKGLELTLPEQDLALLALADPARLRQVLLNVVGNAVKFTEHGGVTIRQGADARHAWVEVRDTGVGIPSAKQATIFDKFVQADGSSRRAYGGTGLGLAITRSLLEMMHGTITVVSDGPGQGTRVRITLPRAVGRGAA